MPMRLTCFFASTFWLRRLIASAYAICWVFISTAHAQRRPEDLSLRTRLRVERSNRFAQGRTVASGSRSAAVAMEIARAQHLQMMAAKPQATILSAPWTPVGPMQVESLLYGKVTGRVNAIAVDTADVSGNTVYLGTLGGGVWKSTNAAGSQADVTFTPLTDVLPVFTPNAESSKTPSLSIGAITVQPGGTGVVLAGTGDPNDALDSYYGEGILRSADNGLTWTAIDGSQDGVAGNHSFAGMGFAGFAWSSASSNLVVAATGQARESTAANATPASFSLQGLYYSTDAGVTWKVATLKDGGSTVQNSTTTSSGNAATAVVWNPVRSRFYAAVRYHGYYESTDGQTWTRLAIQPGTGLTVTACPASPGISGSTNCPLFRGALTVDAATGDIYTLTVGANNVDQGLWRDVCNRTAGSCANASPSFGQKIDTSVMESSGKVIPSADYNLALTVAQNGAETLLFAGTQDIFRCSLSSGCTLRNTTNSANGCAAPAKVAPMQHAIADGGVGAPLYFGNDSGLWRSMDGVELSAAVCSSDDANHFQNLNTALGSLAEVVSFAQDPVDANVLLAGLGANGSAATGAATSTNVWPQLSTGEGAGVAIDQNNPSRWMVSTGEGINLSFCGKGAACNATDFSIGPTITLTQVSGDSALVHAPFFFDPAASSNLILGTCRVWRGSVDTSGTWSSAAAISSMFGGSDTRCTSSNSLIRSLAAGGPSANAVMAGNTGSTVLYAATAGKLSGGSANGGHIYTTTSADTANSSMAWTDITGSVNPSGFDISRILVDPHDTSGKTVYQTIMGFSSPAHSTGHVYGTTDGGIHWTNISGNLPNAPANDVVVDPNDANTVYVALDTGVYVTTAVSTCPTTNCWSVYGTSLPNAPAVGLAASAGMSTGIDGKLGELRVATYGRGIWQIPLITAGVDSNRSMTLSATSLIFSDQPVSTRGASQTVSVTNNGHLPLTINRVAISGDFAEFDDCTEADIAIGSTCSIQIFFDPTRTGARTGMLTVYANIPGGQATVNLSGTGLPPSTVVLNPVAVSFPLTSVGSTSSAINITISNTGIAPVALQTPVLTGDYALTANTCGASLAPDSGCTVAVTFRPTTSGTRNGLFSITDDVGTQTAALVGIGAAPATDTLAPLSLTFSAQQMNTTSAAQTVTLKNSGDVALTLIAARITNGDFIATNTCGTSLIAHSSCVIPVAFVPKSIGAQTGTLVISDVQRSQTVQLNGTAIAPSGVSISPSSPLSFLATGVGLTSSARTITLSNNGGATLTLRGTTLTGDFIPVDGTNTCGATLANGMACSFSIAFKPTAAGVRTGMLSFTDDAPNAPQQLQLTGTGVDFSLFASGPTTATLTSGNSIAYAAILSSDKSLTGDVSLRCSGAPANSTCVINPVASTLGASNLVTITIATGVKTAVRSPLLAWFVIAAPAFFFLRRKSRLAVMIVAMMALDGCGSGRKIPDGGGGSGGGISAPTPTGSYTITLTATAAGLQRSVNYTLIVE